jgi:uncharacterized protein (DUF433 family)
MFIQQTFFHRL